MSRSEWIFLTILIVNTIIAIVYLLWGILFRTKNDLGENRRYSHVIRAVCIFICPVVGLLFFLTGMLIRTVFFRTEVDLEDVIFSKERVRSMVKADEEREKNIVPIQEALVITDYTQTRQLMLNVLKGDINRSLAAIALALDSQDSETSHYAASVLSKELNEFRFNVRRLDEQVHSEDNTVEQQNDCGVMLIEYMNVILLQKVFTEVEQKYFIDLMSQAAQHLYENEHPKENGPEAVQPQKAPDGSRKKASEKKPEPAPVRRWMMAKHYGMVTMRLTEAGAYEKAWVWCDRAMEEYPRDLISYQCRLRLLFETDRGSEFLETLGVLKKSGIVIDNETLEMIRVFQ